MWLMRRTKRMKLYSSWRWKARTYAVDVLLRPQQSELEFHRNYSIKKPYIICIFITTLCRSLYCTLFSLLSELQLEPGLTLPSFLAANCRIWYFSWFYILWIGNLAREAMMSLLMDRLETLVPISITVSAKRESKGENEANLDHCSISFAHFLIPLRVWRPESRTAQPWLKSTRTLRETGHGLSHIKSLDEWGKKLQGMVHHKAECGLK